MAEETAVIKERKVLIELVITEGTANWIKNMVQNPLMDNESSEDRLMREKLFAMLNCLV